jgi:hypothetical protein
MSKALPCSWSHRTIVVGTSGSEDEVCITPPYTLASCSGKVRLRRNFRAFDALFCRMPRVLNPRLQVKHSLDRVIQVLESLGVRQ